MSKKFVGKLAVVTGGSTGMGMATAKRLVQEGMEKAGQFISVFIGGRKDWPSGTRALFGGEVGCRRLLRGAFPRSGTARHQGHHR